MVSEICRPVIRLIVNICLSTCQVACDENIFCDIYRQVGVFKSLTGNVQCWSYTVSECGFSSVSTLSLCGNIATMSHVCPTLVDITMHTNTDVTIPCLNSLEHCIRTNNVKTFGPARICVWYI